jgi:hypothetical protein
MAGFLRLPIGSFSYIIILEIEYSEEKTWQILPMNGVSIPASTSIA